MPKIKIALLLGGVSEEREISLKTGEQIYNALDKSKYKIFKYDTKTDLDSFYKDARNKKFDLVFPALHGPFGEDGRLQGMLDMIQVPYLFSGCLASALAMDKNKTKIIARNVGLKIADDLVIKKNDYNIDEIINKLSLPIVVKPLESGSSKGMSITKSKEELKKGIDFGFKYSDILLLEKYIKGREITAAVMEDGEELKALPIIEIIPKTSDWFDFEAKYKEGGSDEICPAEIPDSIRDRAQEQAVKIFKEIGCKDLARVDYIWDDKQNKLYFLEINTIPGMTALSLVPQAAKANGLEFSEFLDKLISEAKYV